MGRAIVRQPQVFLMDEPLSNLDAKLRVQTRTEIAALQRRLGVTTVYVTHDQVEAMTMGDRVAVLDRGCCSSAPRRATCTAPVNLFVAGFIGSPAMNLLAAKLGDDGATHGSLTVPLTPEQRRGLTSDDVTLGVRPEDWRVSSDSGSTSPWPSSKSSVPSRSSTARTTRRRAASRCSLHRWSPTPRALAPTCRATRISLIPRQLHVFDTATGARL